MKINDYILPFITGGLTLVAIKFSNNVIKSPELSAIIGTFPIGLMAIFFMNKEQSNLYLENYNVLLGILIIGIILLNLLYKKLEYSKNFSYFLSMLFYFIVSLIYFYL